MLLIWAAAVLACAASAEVQEDAACLGDESSLLQRASLPRKVKDSHHGTKQLLHPDPDRTKWQKHPDPDLVRSALLSVGLTDQDFNISHETSTVLFEEEAATAGPSNWLTGWDTSKAEADANTDAAALIGMAGETFSQMGTILGQLMSGQGVTKGDWIKLGEQALNAGVNMAIGVLGNMLSAVGAGFLGLFGSLLTGIISGLFQLFADPPPPSPGQLIKAALAKERMRENEDMWLGLSEEVEALSTMFKGNEHSNSKTAWYLILQHDLAVNRHKVFTRECLNNNTWDGNTWGGDTCKKYVRDGMWEVMLPYAQTHMTVFQELIMQFMENDNMDISMRSLQVETLLLRMKKLGAEYAPALHNAWKIYHPWRMQEIWNPFDETNNSYGQDKNGKDITPYGMDVMKHKEHMFHPFDFLHAAKDQGYDDLDREFPVSRKKVSYERDKDEIRAWAYKGCEGEKHDDVTRKKNPIKPNHVCNLYQRITNSTEKGGCGCGKGKNQKPYYNEGLKDHEKQCWANCMANYTIEQDNYLKDGFLKQVEIFDKYIKDLEFPEKFKVTIQAAGTQCAPQSRIKAEKCEDALVYAGRSSADYKVKREADEHLPAGCSLKDHTLFINDVEVGQEKADYKPLCGALFFPLKN